MKRIVLFLMLFCQVSHAEEVLVGFESDKDLPVLNEILRQKEEDINSLESRVTTLEATGTTVATQAQMEAASNIAAAVTPGRTQYHPGVAKGWAKIDGSSGTPAISVGHNAGAVVDINTGHYKIEWTTDFSSANHADIAVAYRDGTGGTQIVAQVLSQDATSTTVYLTDAATSPIDGIVYVAAFGDQ